MLSRAIILPLNRVLVPRVAEVPTCQNTLPAARLLTAFFTLTYEPLAVVSVLPIWKKKVLPVPWKSRTSFPVNVPGQFELVNLPHPEKRNTSSLGLASCIEARCSDQAQSEETGCQSRLSQLSRLHHPRVTGEWAFAAVWYRSIQNQHFDEPREFGRCQINCEKQQLQRK